MSSGSRYFAHSTNRADRADWQPLAQHLRSVADLASQRAAKFGAGEWGAAAGLLHDVGKYSIAFQARLHGGKPVDHSTAGAIEAAERYRALARPLQFAVPGHHAGLANGGEEGSRRTCLRDRLSARTESYGAYRGEIDPRSELPRLPLKLHQSASGKSDRVGFQCAFFTRMLFSCRVHVREIGQLDDEALAERLRSHEQALCIVNTRLQARELYERLGHQDGCFHLSALMCPKHRSERLARIRSALKDRRQCIVISTTLVEAGVDLDFPVVYRAASGLDQVAQAAGRCNREGRRDTGEVYVFRSAGRKAPGELERRASAAAGIFRRFPDDPLSLEALEEFFGDLYWSEGGDGLDRKRILDRFEERRDDLLFPFEAIARDFRLIESDMRPVLIPFDDEARRLLRQLEYVEHPGAIARKLQPYVVQLHPQQFVRLWR